VSNQLQKFRSFLDRLFPSKVEKIPESKLADFQEFRVWKDVCDELLAKPFPLQSSSSDFSAVDIERDSHVTFTKLSNWEIVCQEILDTQYSHVHYQKCYDELRKRGKSEQEIFEMRRFAWYTAGWLNFPMMLWDWVSLDDSDILRAIELLYDKKQISQEQQIEFENFVKFHL
jgi:hypothetical protein